ncbi:MAG TPA: collagen-binding domain-containing protein [Chthoniobacterales bacterium]|jgi:hypothetical protein
MAANNYNGIVDPNGSIHVGSDSLFTVLTADNFNNLNNQFTGPSLITGNVGIGGKGNYSMSDGTVDGDFYMNSFGTFSMSGPAKITGHLHGHTNYSGFDGVDQTSTLANALADAQAVSLAASNLAGTSNYQVTAGSFHQGGDINISSPANNVTISGIMNNPFNQPIVLSINQVNLSNGNFTLAGNANTTFILNITGKFTINNSNLLLTGGLQASHVLFNLLGSNTTSFNLQQGTQATGVFLAVNRNVDLSGGKIFGRLVTNQLTITSGGQVISQ